MSSLMKLMDTNCRVASALDMVPRSVSIHCPFCHHQGTFGSIGNVKDAVAGSLVQGIRYCPNVECHRLVFVCFTVRSDKTIVELEHFPPNTIDFDTTGLPPGVERALWEAVTCFGAESYNASAVMLRRAIEEMCDDLGVPDDDLVKRISKLSSVISVNPRVIDGLHKIRIFGNQGGHSGVTRYEQVSRKTVEIALGVTKRLIQAAYQDQDVIAKLDAYLDQENEATAE